MTGDAGEPVLLRTTGGLAIEVPGLVGSAVGDQFTVAIRPERIRIEASGPINAGWRPARVIDCSYHGDTQRFQIELESRDILTVFRPNAGQPLTPRGASANVSWGPGDVWVISERAEAPTAS